MRTMLRAMISRSLAVAVFVIVARLSAQEAVWAPGQLYAPPPANGATPELTLPTGGPVQSDSSYPAAYPPPGWNAPSVPYGTGPDPYSPALYNPAPVPYGAPPPQYTTVPVPYGAAAPQYTTAPAPYNAPPPPSGYAPAPFSPPPAPSMTEPATAPAPTAPQAEVLPPAAATPTEEMLAANDWMVWNSAFWDPWEGNVELGLSGTEGNSRTFNVRFGLTAKHKTDTLVRSLQVTTIQKSANSVTTANTALIDGRSEWPLPESRFNYYVHGLAEYDQFKAFDYRFSADGGIGYEFIQNDATTLISRAGLSVSKEVGGNDGDVKPELALGAEYKHKFNPTHSISAKVDYFPNVTDFGDFRVNSQAGWEIALSKAWGLSLKLSVIDRYDSTPQGARPNDLDYSTLAIWQF